MNLKLPTDFNENIHLNNDNKKLTSNFYYSS